MATRRPPLPRLLAHVLLAVALLLQATTTLAMAAGHGLGRMTEAAHAAPEAPMPPCHVLASKAPVDIASPSAVASADCCGPADHGLCAWACSLVVAAPLAGLIRLPPFQPSAAPEGPVVALPSRLLPVPVEPPRAA